MYTRINFKTKKQLKEAVANGELVEVYQPGPFGDSAPTSGRVAIEGPHFPQPHAWYADATIEDSIVVKVR